MNHINKICNEITDFLVLIHEDRPRPVDFRKNMAIKTFGSQQCYLVDGDLKKYNEIVSNILRYNNNNKRFCGNFIEGKFDNLISEVIRDETRLKELVQTLFDTLDRTHFSHKVYLSISGIQATVSPLLLGPYKFIQNPKNTIEKDLLSQVDCLLQSWPAVFASQLKTNIMKEYSGKFVLELVVDADSSKAVELAILKGNVILNILKLYLPCHIMVNNLIDCAIGGRPLNYVNKWLIIDPKNISINFSSSIQGSLSQLELDEFNVELIRQSQIEKILSLIESKKKNKFEEALLRAIDWYIDAGSKERKSDKLLSLAICLECVMTAKGSGAIKDSITENVAVLLGGNLIDRKNTKAALNKLFAERNKIAHGSFLNEAEENMLKYFELVRGVILELVDFIGEVDSLDDIHSKLEDQRLSPKNIE